jgi:hypothetical protein
VTYTNRCLSEYVVRKVDDGAVTATEGWTAAPPADLLARLRPGLRYSIETKGGPFGRIVGWQFGGVWYGRKTDQQVEDERREMVARHDRERRERYERMRGEWLGRTENLPGWLQVRIEEFRRRGGETFAVEGWGYELAICELAALYDQSPDLADTDAVKAYADREGTSGNQHDCAKYLVTAHRAGQSLAGTPAGLTPVTGDPFYEGRQA